MKAYKRPGRDEIDFALKSKLVRERIKRIGRKSVRRDAKKEIAD